MSNRSAWQLASETVAEAYERYIMAAFGNAWAQALVQLAAPGDGDRVLDVACGTGVVARYVAPLVGPTGQVTGLDRRPASSRADSRPMPQRDLRRTEMN
jgi:ubiquinone/menaquinone biosynthesis C-methylase UbiE